jgi:hypothetical protein
MSMMGKLLYIFSVQFWFSAVILRATQSTRSITCNYDEEKLTLLMMEGRACIEMAAAIPGLSTLAGTLCKLRQTLESFTDRMILHLKLPS